MTRRTALCFIAGIPLAARLNAPRAQQPATLDALQQASVKALGWFKSLMEPISQIVAIEERNQLRNALLDLSKDLYGIEQDKALYLKALQRTPSTGQAPPPNRSSSSRASSGQRAACGAWAHCCAFSRVLAASRSRRC